MKVKQQSKREQYQSIYNTFVIYDFFDRTKLNTDKLWSHSAKHLIEIILNFNTVPDDLQLDTLIEFARENPNSKDLHDYLYHLPGMLTLSNPTETAYRQHGWRLTVIFSITPNDNLLVKRNLVIQQEKENKMNIICDECVLDINKTLIANLNVFQISINKSKPIKINSVELFITIINNINLLDEKNHIHLNGLIALIG